MSRVSAESGVNDQRFVARLAAREPAAWEEFLERYDGLIAGVCRRALASLGRAPDDADVADAASEVLRALLERDALLLRRFRTGSSLASYLGVIAHTRTLNLLRGRRAVSSLEEDPADPSAQAEALAQKAERVERLGLALQRLPEQQARLLSLFYLEGLSYARISATTGIAEGNLGMLLFRARESLAREMPESP